MSVLDGILDLVLDLEGSDRGVGLADSGVIVSAFLFWLDHRVTVGTAFEF